jgi:hypothetical protein
MGACFLAGAAPSCAATVDLDGTLWASIGAEEGVCPHLAYAVGLVESNRHFGGQRRAVGPWPWALRWTTRDGRSHAKLFDGRAPAEAQLRQLLAAGLSNIDVGSMQVNVGYHRKEVGDPLELLDPHTNLRVGMRTLRASMASAPGNPVLGVGRFHAGFNESQVADANEYGRAVFVTYKNIID